MIRCNHCGGSVTRTRMRGPNATNDEKTAEYHFECSRCGDSCSLLYMKDRGEWEPALMVDVDSLSSPTIV